MPSLSEDRAPALPPVVSAEEWQVARDDLLREEKELTRALDGLGGQGATAAAASAARPSAVTGRAGCSAGRRGPLTQALSSTCPTVASVRPRP